MNLRAARIALFWTLSCLGAAILIALLWNILFSTAPQVFSPIFGEPSGSTRSSGRSKGKGGKQLESSVLELLVGENAISSLNMSHFSLMAMIIMVGYVCVIVDEGFRNFNLRLAKAADVNLGLIEQLHQNKESALKFAGISCD